MLKKIIRLMVEGATMFIVAALSLLLLLYVAYGDGQRSYMQLHIEKLTAQGLFAQTSIEKFLRDGLPLKQYVGFSTMAAPIVENEDVDAVIVYDDAGRPLFSVMDKNKPMLPAPAAAIKNIKDKTEIEYGSTHYQVVLPLRNRFETVGTVVVISPTRLVTDRLYQSFYYLPFIGAGLSLLFAIVVLIANPWLTRARGPWLQVGYGIVFLAMAVMVVGTLVGLYFNGVQSKAKASAFTLSQRLVDITEFKLAVNDFDGLDRAFAEFRKLNPEISEAALLVDDKVSLSTDASRVGKLWRSDPGNFEYKVDVSSSKTAHPTVLTVTVPRNIVFERVLRSVKDFAALFVASAFLSGLFLQVASSFRMSAARSSSDPVDAAAASDAMLVLIKPVFFLAVFLDALIYSFLPKFMQQAAASSGVSLGFASVPFTAYYLAFALTLIPAGHFADRRGPKPVMLIGLLLAAGSVTAMMLPLDIWAMAGLRAVAGIGQGMLMIGVQSYILAVVSAEKKTRGAAIIVFGFQGGLIAGMALGSMMVNFLHPQGVFAISGAVGIVAILYTMAMVPQIALNKLKEGLGAALRGLARDLGKVLTSLEFLRTILFIGQPAKAVLTGVITFAVPLVLGQAGYLSEDIGQIIMLYGLGVVVTTAYVARLVDRTQSTEAVLFWGALLSGLGLVMVGMLGSPYIPSGPITTIAVVAGVILVGIAHGFINAPVVTHVAQSELASRIGANPVTTTYRFLERIGHVAGPILLSQLFLIWGQGPRVIAAVGIGVAVLGLLFLSHRLFSRSRSVRMEPAE